MKYIKTFESTLEDRFSNMITKTHTADEFKKYIAWLNTEKNLSIDIFINKHIIETFGNKKLPILKVDHLYNFNVNTKELNKIIIKGEISGILIIDEILQRRLIYQSDELQDIIDNIPKLTELAIDISNTIKFNI